MYKNLCSEALGVSGRQSELIELALTYGFKGIDLDLVSFAKQVELRGLEHAGRFLESASPLVLISAVTSAARSPEKIKSLTRFARARASF